MRITRRSVLGMGGGIVATLSLPGMARAQETIEIALAGTRDGSRVWFDPSAFPSRSGRPCDGATGMPATAIRPRLWISHSLLPRIQSPPGVYDYYCIPHEMAGMVGRIIVGEPLEGGTDATFSSDGLPEAALQAFPSVEEIMTKGVVRAADRRASEDLEALLSVLRHWRSAVA